jgi:hypothetical protein
MKSSIDKRSNGCKSLKPDVREIAAAAVRPVRQEKMRTE